MTRKDVLKGAETCVCGEREQDYGSPENNFATIAKMWSAYINAYMIPTHNIEIEIAPSDVAAMLALLKVARIASGHGKDDNWIDLAGYAACGGELESNRR